MLVDPLVSIEHKLPGPLFRVEDFSFTPFLFLVHLNFDLKIRHLETLPENKVCNYIYTCKLMPRLPKIYRHFLTAASRVHSAKDSKQRKGPGKSRLFSTLKEEAKS